MASEAGNEPLADSVAVAATRMGVGKVKIYQEWHAGRLELRKCGRKTLILRSEQKRWLDSLPVATA